VDALLVGGAAAVIRWYPALGSRPADPLELLVRPADVSVAAGVCIALGWRLLDVRGPVKRFASSDRFQLLLQSGAPTELVGALGLEEGYDVVRRQALEVPIDDTTATVLDPADAVLLACARGARTVLPRSFQWLIDMHRIASSDSAPPAGVLATRARELRLVEPLRATLRYLARYTDTPAAARYLAALGSSRGSLRERLEFALLGTPVGRRTAPAHLVAAHLREKAGEPLPNLVGSFPGYVERRLESRNRSVSSRGSKPSSA
jgi:hypothetical protein